MSVADIPEPHQWLLRALCRFEGKPSDWDDQIDLVATRREKPGVRRQRIERAKEVCSRCPVMEQCKQNTDIKRDTGVRFGVVLEDLRKAHGALKKTYVIVESEQWPAA